MIKYQIVKQMWAFHADIGDVISTVGIIELASMLELERGW